MKNKTNWVVDERSLETSPAVFGKSRQVRAYAGFEDDMPTELGGGVIGGGGGGAYAQDSADTQIDGGGFGREMGPSEETSLGSDTFLDEMDQTVLAVPELGTLALLWVLNGDRRGKVYKIKDGDMLGKRDGDLIVDDPQVSTPHCRFRFENKKFVLWDCGSKNGTSVNGKRIRCATPLEENDQIKIGEVMFTFKILK